MEDNDIWDITSLDNRDLSGRIYVTDHQTLLRTKYISCEHHGFREDFLRFSN